MTTKDQIKILRSNGENTLVAFETKMTTKFEKEQLQKVIISLSSTGKKELPSAVDFFQLGLILYEISIDDRLVNIIESYESYIQAIPISFLHYITLHLTQAFSLVIKENSTDTTRISCQSMFGLLFRNPRACQAAYSVAFCKDIAMAYSKLQDDIKLERNISSELLQMLESLLIHGLLSNKKWGNDEEELLENVLELVQVLTEDERNTVLGDMLLLESSLFVATIQEKIPESAERDYLMQMLQSSPKASDLSSNSPIDKIMTVASKKSKRNKMTTPFTSENENLRRIEQVQTILPNYGAGFIESALSHFSGNVDQTVSALLDDVSLLPPTLQILDTKLPARKRESALSTRDYKFDDAQAKKISKERFKRVENQQKKEAFAVTSLFHDEYNDDYDDQYDGMDGGSNLAGVGHTYDDIDLNTIHTYNRVAREAELEDRFWNDNRNLNREESKGNKDGKRQQNSDKKVYRGPDKIRGGRMVGPDGKVLPRQKGGKKGRNSSSRNNGAESTDSIAEENNNNLTKIQKRRKNDNKAKIGNHHRKERAQRKANAGM